ncbi:hypothetical protein GH714_030901 [Hevea brasiliensis]|uniref:RRM domain-containing protein n=1 Tax=Hevea brasiliensis TaxID=3981 RepID=A0A6A6LFD0_HEVBR|nr:hypothetical protein GH714_030901 [Hevea brasiliensis]
MHGSYPLRVVPSKTGIVPVNPTFLPRSEDEYDMCMRTVYCANIDKKVNEANVRLFFETCCGEVQRMRVLQDYHPWTSIAFVEFTGAVSAIAALKFSAIKQEKEIEERNHLDYDKDIGFENLIAQEIMLYFSMSTSLSPFENMGGTLQPDNR